MKERERKKRINKKFRGESAFVEDKSSVSTNFNFVTNSRQPNLDLKECYSNIRAFACYTFFC